MDSVKSSDDYLNSQASGKFRSMYRNGYPNYGSNVKTTIPKVVRRTKRTFGCAICNHTDNLSIINDFVELLMSVFNIQFIDPLSIGMLCQECISSMKICVAFRKQVEAADFRLRQPMGWDLSHKLCGNSWLTRNCNSSKRMQLTAEPPGVKNHDRQPVIDINTLDEEEASIFNKNREEVIIQDIEKEKAYTKLTERVEFIWKLNEGLPWSDTEVEKDKNRMEWEDQNPFSKWPDLDLPKLVPRAQICPVCKKEFENHHKTYIHFQNHYPRYLCEICGKRLSEKQRFRSHMNSHQSIRIPCGHCEREYANPDALRHHIKTKHQNYLPYTCHECGEGFNNYYWKKKHMEVHGVPYNQYDCPECGKYLVTRGGLTRHIEAVHKKLKKVSCLQCGSLFHDNLALQRHSLSHNDEKNFICDFCEKALKTKKSIENHLKIHYNIRDHKCSGCSQDYVSKTALAHHMRSCQIITLQLGRNNPL